MSFSNKGSTDTYMDPPISDEAFEQNLKQTAKHARITPEHITSIIKSAHFFTADQGVFGQSMYDNRTRAILTPPELALLTICVLVLQNGFTVVGKSACAHPENFNADAGRNAAYKDAFNQVYALEGYLLRQRLFEAPRDIPGVS